MARVSPADLKPPDSAHRSYRGNHAGANHSTVRGRAQPLADGPQTWSSLEHDEACFVGWIAGAESGELEEFSFGNRDSCSTCETTLHSWALCPEGHRFCKGGLVKDTILVCSACRQSAIRGLSRLRCTIRQVIKRSRSFQSLSPLFTSCDHYPFFFLLHLPTGATTIQLESSRQALVCKVDRMASKTRVYNW